MKNKLFLFIILLIIAGGGYFIWQNNKAMELMPTNEVMEEVVAEEIENKSVVATYVDISPKKAKELMDNNPELIIIDVSPKYDEGHLPGAINYYVGDGSLDEAIPGLDKESTYLVYCHVDSASIAGATKLIEAGFENVYRLEGNYSAWIEAGYEIEK